MVFKAIFYTFSLLFSYTNAVAISLDDLEETEEEVSVQSRNFEWSGIVDMKAVNVGKDRNWSSASGDFGGRGLTRYGSEAGEYRTTNFHLGMVGIVLDAYSEDEQTAHIQMNISDHRSDFSSEWGNIGLAEAYLLEKFGIFEAKFGFLIPPVSLEHPNVGWSTKYTYTPSAINSWMGEEVRSLGLEVEASPSQYIDVTLAGFTHNDAIATMLTYRGWALHDYQGTLGTRLRWNQIPDPINNTNGWVEPFKELDDRPGAYGKISLHSADKTSLLEVFYYDNFANPKSFDGSNYAWTTSFYNVSLSKKFANGFQILSQYMQGKTKMGPVDVVSADFNAGYVLATYHNDPHRISLRFDKFEVKDTDNFTFPTGEQDLNDSEGQALTAAYMYQMNDNKSCGLEAVSVKSKRNGNEGYGDTDPDDDLYQFVYRVTF